MKRLLRSVMLISVFVFISTSGFAQGSSGRVVYVDKNMGFVIFDLGANDGIKQDSSFRVYRQGAEVAEIKAAKVRKKFTGADIECTYKNKTIKVGDIVKPFIKETMLGREQRKELLHDRVDELLKEAQDYFKDKDYLKLTKKAGEVLRLDPDNREALELLDKVEKASRRDRVEKLLIQARRYSKEMEYELAAEKLQEILKLNPKNREASAMLEKAGEVLEAAVRVEPESIIVDINASKRAIHSTVIDVFKKHGCFITSADPAKYNLQAFKEKDISLFEQIRQEWGPFTRNKLYYRVEIGNSPKASPLVANRLIIHLRGVYDSQGEMSGYKIRKSSAAYKEAEKMVCSIKYLAESL
ncbi:MAG: hypothetical protein JSV30_04825 [Candidatus Omnitrophota bacterium]|nr:MAG: hypothetical protein JSV30_04825 [Candidatus Omnitrophota bacterium]